MQFSKGMVMYIIGIEFHLHVTSGTVLLKEYQYS